MARFRRIAMLAGGLALWYLITGPTAQQIQSKKSYPLPEEIKVIETTLPYETREKRQEIIDSDGNINKKITLEKIVRTENIDFSEDFKIKTERYRIVKDDDWLPSRLVGHTVSSLSKLFFWDWQMGWGLDAEKSRSVLSMLENNKDIKDLTVRINHNEPIYDCYRLFGDEKVENRNNWFARTLLGVPTSILGELFAELRRGDYYNPMNQTVVLYSNIESIAGHEIGHHKDFQRFNSDWEYSLSNIFPPTIMYKEWQASQNSKEILSNDDKWQFNRYLLPAFFSYFLAGVYASKKILQKKKRGANWWEYIFSSKNEESDNKSYIHPLQTWRHFGTYNLSLYSGIAGYSACAALSAPALITYAGFAAGLVGAKKLTDTILKRVVPYEHEE